MLELASREACLASVLRPNRSGLATSWFHGHVGAAAAMGFPWGVS